MTDNHAITPPPELVQQWAHMLEQHTDTEVFAAAARWGANQELEACSQWIHGWYGNGSREVVGNLRARRRPKPLSLKEQALQALDLLKVDASTHGLGFDSSAIRRALESLPND
jgi:hypothetical protein